MAYIIEYIEGGYYCGTRGKLHFWSSDKKDARVTHYGNFKTVINRQSKLEPPSKLVHVSCNCKFCKMCDLENATIN